MTLSSSARSTSRVLELRYLASSRERARQSRAEQGTPPRGADPTAVHGQRARRRIFGITFLTCMITCGVVGALPSMTRHATSPPGAEASVPIDHVAQTP